MTPITFLVYSSTDKCVSIISAKAFQEEEQIKEPDLDPTFDWIAEAKKLKTEALEDNKIRFDR